MKIGLLAMSGIRCCDPKLLKMGLTLPGFVDRSQKIASLPSLGLLYLAAMTPTGHDVQYFEAEADLKEPQEIYDCDLVAISTFTAQVKEAYAIADRLRARSVKVAMGGLHVTVLPDEAAHHADYVIIGEGERAWPAVVDAASRGVKSARFNAKDSPAIDVAHLPVPRYDLLRDRPYSRFTVQTSRGCPWRCDFCASTVMLSQKYRKRPVDQVIRDLRAIMAVRENPFIEFADDNTFVDKAWGRQLCEEMKPLRLKWFTETDITVAQDEALLDAMHDAGCRQVLIGLESPTRNGLSGIELHNDFKARWFDRYVQSIHAIQSHGITVNGCFILGLDGHTTGIFEQVLDFSVEFGLYDVQITYLTAFPGTPLYDRLLRENRVIEPGAWEKCTLFDVNFIPTHMTSDELREGMYWLGERLYSQECTAKRRAGFFQQMKSRGREIGVGH